VHADSGTRCATTTAAGPVSISAACDLRVRLTGGRGVTRRRDVFGIHAGSDRQRRHGLGSTAADRRSSEAGKHATELLAEVVVHPRVEERIVDGGAHGDDVRCEEDKQEVGRLTDRLIVLERQKDHVTARSRDRSRDVTEGSR